MTTEAPEQATSPADLVRSASAGDDNAWAELVARYTPLLYRIVRSYRLDEATSSDVVQTAWLRLIERLATLRDADAVGGWLATTTRRECLSLSRKRSAQRPFVDAMDSTDPAPSPEDVAVASDFLSCLAVALGRLAARDRQLLSILSVSPRPSYVEVSAAIGMPIGSIGPTRIRALHRLRLELASLGVHDLALTE